MYKTVVKLESSQLAIEESKIEMRMAHDLGDSVYFKKDFKSMVEFPREHIILGEGQRVSSEEIIRKDDVNAIRTEKIIAANLLYGKRQIENNTSKPQEKKPIKNLIMRLYCVLAGLIMVGFLVYSFAPHNYIKIYSVLGTLLFGMISISNVIQVRNGKIKLPAEDD